MTDAAAPAVERTVYRACHLCEAICGLEIKIQGDRISSIRGDQDDPFSRGHICPKAVALKDIHEDPDRLRQPMRRVGNEWQAISWDEAFDLAADRIAAVHQASGANAVAVYAGNPSVHNSGTLINVAPLIRLLKTRNAFSATSVDQLPQQLTSFLMFGHQFLIPIPDIDHTQHFLIIGGNPIASNGSMMTVPDVAKRLTAIQQRGGKVVVIDPRRTETAAIADEHHFIRPANDAALLMAMINVMREENLFRITQPEKLNGLDTALSAIAPMTPALAAEATGIDAATIARLAREFALSPSAICYGRMGTTVQSFGTLNQWLVQLMNIVTGNLDAVGGTMVTQPLLPLAGDTKRPGGFARWRSRVRGLPESGGELPVAALAEEIDTQGEGQIRSLITICGNPVLSTPNGRQLERSLGSLDFMVSIDIYRNETTRFADLILPPASSLNHPHYDTVFNAFAVRNVTRYNEALWPRAENERYDWEILGELGRRIAARLGSEFAGGVSTDQLLARALAAAPISLEELRAKPHGIDLGPLAPSLYARLQTSHGKIECAPEAIIADIARCLAASRSAQQSPLTMIGRRHVRSNNSWMHNSHRLMKGKPRHHLLMHPDDLAAYGLVDGGRAVVTSRVGSVTLDVRASADMMRGVVSLPHGFGHHRDGVALREAALYAGESANDLTDHLALDAVSGNAALNGVGVSIEPAPKP